MEIHSALTNPAGVELWRLGTEELLGLITDLGSAMCAIDGLWLRAIADADRRGAGVEQGATSTQRWLSEAGNLAPGAASRAVRLALGLEHRPEVAAALGRGEISAEHAKVILHVLAELPDDLPNDGATECETYLLNAARQEDAVVLGRRGTDLLHRLCPEAVELTEEEAVAAREFRITASGHPGLCKITGSLDTEAAELARSILSPLAAPRPKQDGVEDPRTPAHRMGDAFVELCQRAAEHACVPGEAYTRPHITLTMDAEALVAGRGAAAHLMFLGPLSAAAARRLACDCEVTPVTLDEHGVPLDLGRSTYIVSGGLRRALTTRDRGCAFPGCGRPSSWCHAHHRIHWADGGPTSLDNLVLLCGHHHRMVHHKGWTVILGDDRHPWFIPPSWIDPDQVPRPSHARGPAPPVPAVA
ncbi:MAG: HNH endonuclease [Actinomycetota bacterium]|nr:HNH endonuclease [Actinomycetota bacterium]